ncbi:MAG: hypothetical protein BWY91_00628 [bacterium ADurb.BinA028]|nr:MAG: hypothetical protein BWY91_00628 [bacterium ADurb.BinA028]
MGVDPPGDGGQALGAVPHGIHAGDDREQDLRGADVRGGLLAADVLLAGLQGQAVGGRSVRVDRHPDQSAGHRALQAGAHRHEAGVRTAEAHGHAEALGRADGDVCSPLPRRGKDCQGQQVGRSGEQRADLVRGGSESTQRPHLTVGPGVLHEHAEDRHPAGSGAQLLTGRHCGEVGDDDADAQWPGPGLHDGERLGEGVRVDDQHRVVGQPGGAAHEGHRLGGRRGLVQQRRTGDRQPGQVRHHRLEVEQRLEPALGDLRLIRGVGRVPRRVLEDLARDDRRADGAVVAQPDHRSQHAVAPGQRTQLGDDRGLGVSGGQRQRRVAPDEVRQGGVDEGVERGLPDDRQHVRDVGLPRTDVPPDEGRQGGRGGGRVLRHTSLRATSRTTNKAPSVEPPWPLQSRLSTWSGCLRGSGVVAPSAPPWPRPAGPAWMDSPTWSDQRH